MPPVILEFLQSFWTALGEMSPYLLFGFGVAGLLSVLISPQVVERHLGGTGIWPVVKAALFGVPLPLCSCGVIPVAASLRRHGASKGATTSFLLSTPVTGIDSILVTFSMLGFAVALFRPLAAFAMGILGGILVNAFGTSAGGADIRPTCEGACCIPGGNKRGKFAEALHYGFITLPQDIGKPLLIGLLIAAGISAAFDKGFIGAHVSSGTAQMFVMMAIGIPLYVCATASVPIAAALVIDQSISPGAALVFLITGPATNAATVGTIWKVMGGRTAIIYLVTVAGSALASGALLDRLVTVQDVHAHVHEVDVLPMPVKVLSAIVLAGLIGWSAYAAWKAKAPVVCPTGGASEFDVEGMHCTRCASAIEQALAKCEGVTEARVDFSAKKAYVKGGTKESVRGVITGLGYGAKDAEDADEHKGHRH